MRAWERCGDLCLAYLGERCAGMVVIPFCGSAARAARGKSNRIDDLLREGGIGAIYA